MGWGPIVSRNKRDFLCFGVSLKPFSNTCHTKRISARFLCLLYCKSYYLHTEKKGAVYLFTFFRKPSDL